MPFRNRIDISKLPRSRQLEEGSYKNGLRHCIFNSAYDKYTGDWKRDKWTGKGALLNKKNDLYEGDFLNNHRHGAGVLSIYMPKYKVWRLNYRGEWRNGRMHGRGKRAYPEGFYFGDFKDGMRNGNGQMWYDNGHFYDGEWLKDNREGEGLLVRGDGNRYEGNWKDDQQHGKGRLYFLNVGQVMIGVWRYGNCVWSVIRDLPFRQGAQAPTIYPIPTNTLVDLEKVCDVDETLALYPEKSEDILVEYRKYESTHSVNDDEY